MADKTLADLRAEVRFRGDYQNVKKYPNDDVDKTIQRAFKKFWQIVDECNEGWWDTYGTVTTVAAQEYVALPTGTWSVKDVKRLDGSSYVDLNQISAKKRSRYDATNGTPSAYFLASRGIELCPTPDAVYSLRVLYTPVAPDLSEAVERNWYNGWDDYVIAAALLELDRRDRRPDLGDREREVQQAEAALRSGATKRGEQEPEYLDLHEGATGDVWDDGVW